MTNPRAGGAFCVTDGRKLPLRHPFVMILDWFLITGGGPYGLSMLLKVISFNEWHMLTQSKMICHPFVNKQNSLIETAVIRSYRLLRSMRSILDELRSSLGLLPKFDSSSHFLAFPLSHSVTNACVSSDQLEDKLDRRQLHLQHQRGVAEHDALLRERHVQD